MKSLNEMSNVNFELAINKMRSVIVSYQNAWISLWGQIPCIPWLAVFLHSNGGTRIAPNLTKLLHEPMAELSNQAINSMKIEINSLLLESKEKNINPFSCSHNEGDAYTSLTSKGCNWRKSGCAKNYWECFQLQIPWNSFCKCTGCKNCSKSEPSK